jgi:dTDP-4-amino-4,6-dideoxygalactose transaminase
LYVCRLKKRDALKQFLEKRNIFPGIHYPSPIHLQPAYEHEIEIASGMYITESICNEIISLPMYPELPHEDAQKIVNTILSFFNAHD